MPTLSDNGYELVIAIDILEHFIKQDGLVFLQQLRRVVSKAVLISTPKEFIEQDVAANPDENHLSLWGKEDLLGNNFTTILDNDLSWVAVSDCCE